ncbi:hypothetical protein V6N13_148045 [Hibiscus sabdariffa]|uniref:Uncharacterized protein n=1 Tax=Hibiscus sabdariffa TaxID=183260 RepID=A0ABR2TXC9_9ROSI
MVVRSFTAKNGICGGTLGSCNPTPSLSLQPDAKDKGTRLGKVVSIIVAVIGVVSLALIVVILYFRRRPVEIVAPLKEKPITTRVIDIYFLPKEWFTFQDLLEVGDNFDESFIIGGELVGWYMKLSYQVAMSLLLRNLYPKGRAITI